MDIATTDNKEVFSVWNRWWIRCVESFLSGFTFEELHGEKVEETKDELNKLRFKISSLTNEEIIKILLEKELITEEKIKEIFECMWCRISKFRKCLVCKWVFDKQNNCLCSSVEQHIRICVGCLKPHFRSL